MMSSSPSSTPPQIEAGSRSAYAYTVEKGPETVLYPALLGPRASPFLFSEVVTLEQWSETFLLHQGTQFKGNLTHNFRHLGSKMGARALLTLQFAE